MRLLVDTSAYSLALRGYQSAVKPLRAADELCFSPIVRGELTAGFRRGTQEKLNRDRLADFLAPARVRVLTITEITSEHYSGLLAALLKQGTKIPTNDIWIAASAIEYGLTLLTADRHFLHCPVLSVEVLEP
jgi:tRNA(fMet)-specific endonuclease VapC